MQNIGNNIRNIITNINPDIIIAYDKMANFIIKDTLNLDIPVITMFHFDPQSVFKKSWPYLNKSLEHAECIQVLSPNFIPYICNVISPKRIEYIPNIVPQYNNTIDFSNQKIINIARINREQKRQHILIEAFNNLKYLYPEWSVEIYGETNEDLSYFNELTILINKYNLKNQVKLCGTTKNIKNILKSASIFAFPSKYEGFPLALTEAMSMGLSSIAFNSCSGVNDIIKNNKNGILCNESIESFTYKLDNLMKNKNLRFKLGTQAKKDMKKYSASIIWNQWEDLIYSIVNNYKK